MTDLRQPFHTSMMTRWSITCSKVVEGQGSSDFFGNNDTSKTVQITRVLWAHPFPSSQNDKPSAYVYEVVGRDVVEVVVVAAAVVVLVVVVVVDVLLSQSPPSIELSWQ